MTHFHTWKTPETPPRDLQLIHKFSKVTRKKPQYFFYTPIMNSLRKKLEIAGRMGVTDRKRKKKKKRERREEEVGENESK